MVCEIDEETRIAIQCMAWLMRLERDGPACYDFVWGWMLQSRRHVEAFLRNVVLLRCLENIGPSSEIDRNVLIAQARGMPEPRIDGPFMKMFAEIYGEDS